MDGPSKPCSVIAAHEWVTGPWGLAIVDLRCDELFGRLGLMVRSWEHDGLGPAVGGLVRLPSGRVVLVEELSHAVEHLGIPGPYIYADASDVATRGVSALVDEVLDALRLRRDQLSWTQTTASEPDASKHAAEVREWQAGRRGTGSQT